MGNDNKKGKQRGKKFVWFERMLRREGRKLCAVALCASMIIGNMAWPAAAASDTSGEYSFELSRASLYDALQEAVSEGETVETDLEFMGEWAEDYAELLEADGSLYELSPTIKNKDEDRDKVLDLRVFARIENDIEFDSAYEIDGSEEIIFLLVNSSEVYQKAVIAVDERESDTITVLPASAVEVDTEEAVTVDAVNPVTTTTTTSGGGGGGSHSTNDIVIDNTEESEAAEYKDSEVELLNTEDPAGTTGTELNETEAENETEAQEEDDTEEQPDETSGGSTDPSSEDTRGSDTDTEEEKDDADGTGTGTENSSGDATSENSDNSNTQGGEGTGTGDTGDKNTGKDETGDSESGNTGAESSGDSGEGNTGDSESTGNAGETGTDTESGSGSGEGAASDTTGDSGNTETGGSRDTDNSGDDWGDSDVTVSSAISVHPTWRLTAAATASDAEQNVASPSDADDYLAGTIYETVRLDEDGVAAFVTTAGDMELDDEIFAVASASDATKLSAKTENVSVVVSADEGVLPEGTELVVTELNEDDDDTSDQYQEAVDALTDGGVEYDEMLALDISLVDENGDEIEPEDGEVEVTISLNTDILPEGIEADALAVQHLVENSDGSVEVNTVADSTDDTDGSLDVTGTAVLTSFSVESFSSFTITWRNGNGGGATTYADITVTYMDEGGTVLNGSENGVTLSSTSTTITLADYSDRISDSGYEYVGAYYYNDNGEKIYTTTLTVNRENTSSGFWPSYTYTVSDQNGDVVAQQTGSYAQAVVYLDYKEATPLSTFQRLDTEGIIDINLYNLDATSNVVSYSSTYPFQFHSSQKYNGWTGSDGGVRQGLVNNVLGSNGYPELKSGYINSSGSESNIGALFDGKTARGITYLLQKDDDGYYYYDSGENFATLDSDGIFALYEVPRGSGLAADYPLFLPFNTLINNQQTTGTNVYYPLGLTDFAENVNTDSELRTHNADYYMGMEVGFDFIMPKDGKLDEDDEMVFEFEGDDDVWVFIDNVLVLDMGGVHDNYGGSINFATGAVEVDAVYNTGSDLAGTSTTISEMFQKADSEWDSTAYKTHTFKMFYFERGAGGSNCKMRFNMPPIPSGTINFGKNISYSNLADSADFDFEFKAYVNYSGEDSDGSGTEDDEDYVLYEGSYKIYTDAALTQLLIDEDSDGNGIRTTENGSIYLKDGQYAQLLGGGTGSDTEITAVSKYYIVEVGVTSDKYDVTVNGTETSAVYDTEDVDTVVGAKSSYLTVGEVAYVVVDNDVSDDNAYNLEIEKEFGADSTVDENAEFTVYVYLGSENETLYTGDYDIYDAKTDTKVNTETLTASDGAIVLKTGQYAKITGLVGGNTIRVVEVGLDEEKYLDPAYEMTAYSLTGAARLDTENGGIVGTVLEGKELKESNNNNPLVHVTVTNNTKPSVKIKKVVTGNMADRNKEFSFTVSVTDANGRVSYPEGTYTRNDDTTQTVTVDENGKFILKNGQSFTIENVSAASITVTENNYTSEGYTTTVSVNNDSNDDEVRQAVTQQLTGGDVEIIFTNTKGINSPTGIFTEHLPYALMVMAALLGAVWLVNDRRKKI